MASGRAATASCMAVDGAEPAAAADPHSASSPALPARAFDSCSTVKWKAQCLGNRTVEYLTICNVEAGRQM